MEKNLKELLEYLLEKQSALMHEQALRLEEIERLEGLIKTVDQMNEERNGSIQKRN